MKEAQMKISTLLKKSRLSKNMTQKQLAAEIGVSAGRLAQWESGHDVPTDRLQQLSKLLDFSMDKPVKVEKSVNVEKTLKVKKSVKKKPEAKTKKANKKAEKPAKTETKPEAKKPEAKKPEAKKPEAKKPEAKKPEAKKPEAKKPEAKSLSKEKPIKAKKKKLAKAKAEKIFLDNSYGKELKAARISNNLSQKQVADALKLSPGRIAQWENGRSVPNEDRKKQLNDLLQKGSKQTPKAANPKVPSKAAPKVSDKKEGNKDILINIKSLAKDTGMSVKELVHILNLCGLKIEHYQIRVEEITPDIINKIKSHDGAAKRECIKDDEIFLKDIECLKNLTAKRIDSVLRKLGIAKVRRFAKGELKFGKVSKSAILMSDAQKLENYFNRYNNVGDVLTKYIH